MQYIDPERCGGRRIKRFFAGIDQGNREYERILDEYVERLSDAVFNIRMLYDDTVLIGGELGEYADYFIEKYGDSGQPGYLPGRKCKGLCKSL